MQYGHFFHVLYNEYSSHTRSGLTNVTVVLRAVARLPRSALVVTPSRVSAAAGLVQPDESAISVRMDSGTTHLTGAEVSSD